MNQFGQLYRHNSEEVYLDSFFKKIKDLIRKDFKKNVQFYMEVQFHQKIYQV